MFAFFLLAALIGVVYLMFWMVQNDEAIRIEDQRGLLRMTLPKGTVAVPEEDAKPAKRRGNLVQPPSPRAPDRGPPGRRRLEPAADSEAGKEEEIVHPMWQGRRPGRRP